MATSDVERQGTALNPLARLDAAVDHFIGVAEDFMIRTSYQTDKQTSREIASLKNKRQNLVNALVSCQQKCTEIRRGYAFLTAQLDELIRELENILAEEQVNG